MPTSTPPLRFARDAKASIPARMLKATPCTAFPRKVGSRPTTAPTQSSFFEFGEGDQGQAFHQVVHAAAAARAGPAGPAAAHAHGGRSGGILTSGSLGPHSAGGRARAPAHARAAAHAGPGAAPEHRGHLRGNPPDRNAGREREGELLVRLEVLDTHLAGGRVDLFDGQGHGLEGAEHHAFGGDPLAVLRPRAQHADLSEPRPCPRFPPASRRRTSPRCRRSDEGSPSSRPPPRVTGAVVAAAAGVERLAAWRMNSPFAGSAEITVRKRRGRVAPRPLFGLVAGGEIALGHDHHAGGARPRSGRPSWPRPEPRRAVAGGDALEADGNRVLERLLARRHLHDRPLFRRRR